MINDGLSSEGCALEQPIEVRSKYRKGTRSARGNTSGKAKFRTTAPSQYGATAPYPDLTKLPIVITFITKLDNAPQHIHPNPIIWVGKINQRRQLISPSRILCEELRQRKLHPRSTTHIFSPHFLRDDIKKAPLLTTTGGLQRKAVQTGLTLP